MSKPNIKPQWIDDLARQYGARQLAALEGREQGYITADYWLKRIAEEHWHEIIAALRRPPLPKDSIYRPSLTSC